MISWTGQPDSNIARVKVWGLVIDPRASRDWGAHNGAEFPSKPLKMSQDPTFRRRRPAWSLRAAQGLSGGISSLHACNNETLRKDAGKDASCPGYHGSRLLLLRSRALTPDIPSSQLSAARNMALAPRIGQRHTPWMPDPAK